ncbi:MAG: hypothetical protein JWO72_3281, partial [Caulobacteraceae bacterium]|nr:hypothetical protein [Caulobacteraceae bacterium]
MNRLIAVLSIALSAGLAATDAPAQNLVIANARIVVGDGQVIEKGAVVVKDGRIASVVAGRAPAPAKGAKL